MTEVAADGASPSPKPTCKLTQAITSLVFMNCHDGLLLSQDVALGAHDADAYF